MDEQKPPGIMTPEEVGAILRVKRGTVLHWCRKGVLKAFKAGALWRIHREDFEAFVAGDAYEELARIKEQA